MRTARPVHIAHVIYSLRVGGLENGLVNLLNRLSPERYRHSVICLTDYSEFAQRIRNPAVDLVALNKRPGHDWRTYRALFRLFRKIAPDIVHTRNLAAQEAQLIAWLAGVKGRVHGEHGRDLADKDGTNAKYILQRRLLRPFVQRYVALSKELQHYLEKSIRVPPSKITRIINGVDTRCFCPGNRKDLLPPGFIGEHSIIFGTVGRFDPVKDQETLVRAFIGLCAGNSDWKHRARLVLIGDGEQREVLSTLVVQAGLQQQVWFAGLRDDVADLLKALDVFILPSLAEGISNTIMEAMASGLPVLATDVGGNGELVVGNETGFLVKRADPAAMAEGMARFLRRPEMIESLGRAGRERAEQCFSLETMVSRYRDLYDAVSAASGKA